MKPIKILGIVLLVVTISCPVFSQYVNKDELPQIATNWIQIITEQNGHWGGSETAIAGAIEDFQFEEKLIGYFCNVQPKGFMVFSLHHQLAPVKAWSANGVFDPNDEHGIEGVIGICMTRIIDTIESRYGPIKDVEVANLESMTEVDYRANWPAIKNLTFGTSVNKRELRNNYTPGDTLIPTNWDQFPPYNNNCPHKNCSNTSNGRAVVGCVATAAAQIMKYWGWPPGYDWPNMPIDATTASPPAQQAAVALLCSDIGQAVEMDYGCDGSSAYHTDMADVYKDNFSYHSTVTVKYRSDYSASDWFNLIKFNLDRNRPIQYGVPRHSIVCDGYRENFTTGQKEYHMNYGWWGLGEDTWYVLDALPGSNTDAEDMIHRTFPSPSMGYSLAGTYLPIPVYKYFEQDVAGLNATFLSGHKLQALHGIKIFGSGTSSYLKFYGSTGTPTLIFTRGDQSRGIDIQNGGIRLHNYGGIKLN